MKHGRFGWIFVTFLLFAPAFFCCAGDKPRPEKTVEATQLIRELKENSIAFERNYKNTVIAVTGRVDKIGKQLGFGKTQITLRGGSGLFEGIECLFEEENVDTILKLKVGDTATVVGYCKGALLGKQISLEDCYVK